MPVIEHINGSACVAVRAHGTLTPITGPVLTYVSVRDVLAAVRDEAVRRVDEHHGYTVEFAPSPEAHREEYDREVERLLDA